MEGVNKLFYIFEAEFVEFRGFDKPRIKILKAGFKRKLQVLNSTNGCGKSTFISELNPFTINKGLFKKNGYKIIRFKYGEERYELYSSRTTNRLINLDNPDVNLCSGGTISQLHTVIETMFGITPFSWAVSMGSIKFTRSQKDVRRKWIELISGIDLDYPFKILAKLSAQLNASRSVYKHLNSQIATEANKLLKYEDVLKAADLRDSLAVDVKDILMSRDINLSKEDHNALANNITRLQSECKTVYDKYIKLSTVVNPFDNLTSMESVTERYRANCSQIALLGIEIEGLIALQEDKNGLLTKIEAAGSVDIESLTKELDYHNEALSGARAAFKSGNKLLPQYLRDPETAFSFCQATDKVEFNFQDEVIITYSLEDDSFDTRITEDEFIILRRNLKDKQDQMDNTRRSIASFEDVLKHLKDDCRDVDCPSCHTTFPLGSDQIADTQRKIDVLNARILVISPELGDLTEQYEAISAVLGLRKAVINTLSKRFSNYPWYVTYLSGLIENACSVSELGQVIQKDANTAYSINIGYTSKLESERITGLIETYKKVNEVTCAENLDREVMELTASIGKLRREREVIKDEQKELVKLGTLAREHVALLTTLKDNLVQLGATREKYLLVLNERALTLLERDLQLKLAEVTKQVNDNDILISLVDSLTVMLNEAEEKIASFKILDKAFNTSTGIIGEQLVGYTKAFSEQVTSAIEQLWGYPMKILPCTIDGKKGMNYDFPVDVGGEEPVPDVSKGSDSMVSVIDLAIMLCTRMSLGLDQLPLFLDEVGGGFDTIHNERLVGFIRMLLSDYDCSNLFLVHHDIALRNMLGDRDTVVFDSSQVVVEPNYNEHVTITKYKD